MLLKDAAVGDTCIVQEIRLPFQMERRLEALGIEYDVTLNDGETIGFSADDKHAITRSEGAALPGMTLKIEY